LPRSDPIFDEALRRKENAIASAIAIITAAYFIGALPHLQFLVRLRRVAPAADLHIALWQQAGPLWGFAAAAIDVLKGIGAVVLTRALGFDIAIIVAVGIAAACGQMWPVFKKFDGEKGNTTGFGAAAAIAVWPTLLALIPVFLAIFSKLVKAIQLKNIPRTQRFKTGAGQSAVLPIAVAISFTALPLVAWVFGEPPEVVAGFIALAGLVFFRRLTAGLSQDLATAAPRRAIFWRRLFLDRPA